MYIRVLWMWVNIMFTARHVSTAVFQQAKVHEYGLGLQPRLYATFVCNDSTAQLAYVAIVVLLYERTLPLFTYNHFNIPLLL